MKSYRNNMLCTSETINLKKSNIISDDVGERLFIWFLQYHSLKFYQNNLKLKNLKINIIKILNINEIFPKNIFSKFDVDKLNIFFII